MKRRNEVKLQWHLFDGWWRTTWPRGDDMKPYLMMMASDINSNLFLTILNDINIQWSGIWPQSSNDRWRIIVMTGCVWRNRLILNQCWYWYSLTWPVAVVVILHILMIWWYLMTLLIDDIDIQSIIYLVTDDDHYSSSNDTATNGEADDDDIITTMTMTLYYYLLLLWWWYGT